MYIGGGDKRLMGREQGKNREHTEEHIVEHGRSFV